MKLVVFAALPITASLPKSSPSLSLCCIPSSRVREMEMTLSFHNSSPSLRCPNANFTSARTRTSAPPFLAKQFFGRTLSSSLTAKANVKHLCRSRAGQVKCSVAQTTDHATGTFSSFSSDLV